MDKSRYFFRTVVYAKRGKQVTLVDLNNPREDTPVLDPWLSLVINLADGRHTIRLARAPRRFLRHCHPCRCRSGRCAHRDGRSAQRIGRPVHQPAEDIPPKFIRPEYMRTAGGLQPFGWSLF